MKISLSLLFCASVFVAQAQDTSTESAAADAPVAEASAATASGPSMIFESSEIDYGTIAQNSDPLRIFKFTNEGTEPLIIKGAKGSCGCTVPVWPKEPIAPGEASSIEVRYDTKRVGPFQKTVTLTTNEAEEKHVLMIKGKVEPEAATEDALPEASPSLLDGSGSGK